MRSHRCAMTRLPCALGTVLPLLSAGLPLPIALPGPFLWTGGLQDQPGRCEGSPVGDWSEPLGECKSLEVDGVKYFQMKLCSNSTFQSITLIDSKGCEVGPSSRVFEQNTTLDKCVAMPGMRGISMSISCNRNMATFEAWSLAPPAPATVRCDDSLAGASALLVACQVNASSVDEVSFEVSTPSGRPFLGMTAKVGPSGEVRKHISGLRPGTQYRIVARSHRRGENEGNPDTWSGVGLQSAVCSTKASSPEQRLQGRQGGRLVNRLEEVRTRWVEVYRMVSSFPGTPGAPPPLPDFLDQHNGADLAGLMGMLSLYMQSPRSAPMPITRYCVEALDVQLPNVTTASVDGRPQAAPFADFVSCNQGQCRCMHQVDRSIARLPGEQIMELCSGYPYADTAQNTCHCPASSAARSSRYIGRSPIPLPFHVVTSLTALPLQLPADYPPPFKPEPMGHFYSFPSEGKCAAGEHLSGSSCTWQRSPVFHTVYSDDLVRLGFNVSASVGHTKVNSSSGRPISWELDYDAALHNLEVTARAFSALGTSRCGEDAAPTSEPAMALWWV